MTITESDQFIVYLEPKYVFRRLIHDFMIQSAKSARNSAHDYEMVHCTLTSFFDMEDENAPRDLGRYIGALEKSVRTVQMQETNNTCVLSQFRFEQYPYTMKFTFQSEWLTRVIECFTEEVNAVRSKDNRISTDKTKKLHISLAYGPQYQSNTEVLIKMYQELIADQLISCLSNENQEWRIVMYQSRKVEGKRTWKELISLDIPIYIHQAS